jgi:hypothetical protein
MLTGTASIKEKMTTLEQFSIIESPKRFKKISLLIPDGDIDNV